MVYDVPETLSPVRADAALLERVVANLVENAMRWSPGDRPARVTAGRVHDRVDLRVIDHGPGIAAGSREQVFQPFQRLGDRGGTGVGLGLAVARGLRARDGRRAADRRHARWRDDRGRESRDRVVSLVLAVDDEPQLLRALITNLRARGYEVDGATTGEIALEMAARHHPDVVVLDLGLPTLSGIDVIHGLRGWSEVPIIVLSARDAERDKIAALDAGADDYVTKPFGMGELLARVRAALRRGAPATEEAIVATDAFTIDLAAKRVTNASGEVRLTPTEWHLVEMLVRNAGKLVSQGALLREVWGPEYGTETNYLRVYMAHIRRKLEPDPANPVFFITEPGMGYRFESPESDGVAAPATSLLVDLHDLHDEPQRFVRGDAGAGRRSVGHRRRERRGVVGHRRACRGCRCVQPGMTSSSGVVNGCLSANDEPKTFPVEHATPM